VIRAKAAFSKNAEKASENADGHLAKVRTWKEDVVGCSTCLVL
jgi:hypothetical protein